MKELLREVWRGLRDPNHVLFADGQDRYFSRCVGCGRVFMHYWACVTAADRNKGRRVGCHCGSVKFRVARLPEWQQVWFLFSRFIWRKLVKKETFWDPRMLSRRA